MEMGRLGIRWIMKNSRRLIEMDGGHGVVVEPMQYCFQPPA